MIKVLALELLGVELAITELNLNVGGIRERKGVLNKGGLGGSLVQRKEELVADSTSDKSEVFEAERPRIHQTRYPGPSTGSRGQDPTASGGTRSQAREKSASNVLDPTEGRKQQRRYGKSKMLASRHRRSQRG